MLTNKGKYGLKAMMHLAGLDPSELAQVAEVAEANSISKKFLALIALVVGMAASDGAFDPVLWSGLVGPGFERASPTEIVGQVLGGDAVEPFEPLLEAAVVGVDVVDVEVRRLRGRLSRRGHGVKWDFGLGLMPKRASGSTTMIEGRFDPKEHKDWLGLAAELEGKGIKIVWSPSGRPTFNAPVLKVAGDWPGILTGGQGRPIPVAARGIRKRPEPFGPGRFANQPRSLTLRFSSTRIKPRRFVSTSSSRPNVDLFS